MMYGTNLHSIVHPHTTRCRRSKSIQTKLGLMLMSVKNRAWWC